MSEKSSKARRKLAAQKKHKDEVLKQEKEHTVEVSHHAVSGNPTTLAEEEAVVDQVAVAPTAQEKT